jgi:hypothetical protein
MATVMDGEGQLIRFDGKEFQTVKAETDKKNSGSDNLPSGSSSQGGSTP